MKGTAVGAAQRLDKPGRRRGEFGVEDTVDELVRVGSELERGSRDVGRAEEAGAERSAILQWSGVDVVDGVGSGEQRVSEAARRQSTSRSMSAMVTSSKSVGKTCRT